MKIEQDKIKRDYHFDIKEIYDRFPELKGRITWISYEAYRTGEKVYISTESKE